ncbi:hypothetical protein FD733_14550 [Pantoea sp. Eser]|nr:hypothetical protein [Pantoea sp. Eser]
MKIRRKLLTHFSCWEQDLIALFRDAQQCQLLSPALTPESAAAMVINLYEGVMIRIRVEATTYPYNFLTQTLPQVVFVH